SSSGSTMLDRLFRLRENRTDPSTELLAGLTTFMTMAYIIVVNPLVLAGTAGYAGPPLAATVAATCLGAAIPTLLMGRWANHPLALASGMGLNGVLILAVGTQTGVTWQVMMGVIFLEGLIISILVLTKLRESIMNAIP